MEIINWDAVENTLIEQEDRKELSLFLCDMVIEKLTPRETALFLAMYDGYTCVEIAGKWGMTPRAVNKTLNGLKDKIRSYLVDSQFSSYVSTSRHLPRGDASNNGKG